MRKNAIEKKREIEGHIRVKIPETNFYKRYKSSVLDWYNTCFEEALLITGGYGIGKSRTIRQILDDEGIKYKVLSEVFYRPKKVEEIVNAILELDNDVVVIFDDCKLTRWLEYSLLHLLNKGYPIVIIANSWSEIEKLEKVLGRLERVELMLEREDIKILTDHLSNIYNISYDKYIILNIRDIVNATLKEVFGLNTKLSIEEVMTNIDIRKKRKQRLIEMIKALKERGYSIDYELIVEIGVKLLGYRESTLRRNLTRYITLL